MRARTTFRKLMAGAAYRLGLTQAVGRAGSRWELGANRGAPWPVRRGEEPLLILVYHRVNDERDPFSIDAISTGEFRRQLEYLRRQFTLAPLDDVLDRWAGGQRLPPRCAVITFDDGYEDNHRFAFPLLQRFRAPATIFLTAGCVERRERLWFDRVLRAYRGTQRSSAALPGLGLRQVFQGPPGRVRAAHQTLEALKRLAMDARSKQIRALVRELGVEEGESDAGRLMTWEQAESMARAGIAFGSHTMNHPTLSVEDSGRVAAELRESKALIESRLGRPVRLFAYPNGKPNDYTGAVRAAVAEAGYGLALTTRWGVSFPSDDRYELRRIPPCH